MIDVLYKREFHWLFRFLYQKEPVAEWSIKLSEMSCTLTDIGEEPRHRVEKARKLAQGWEKMEVDEECEASMTVDVKNAS